MAIEYWLPAICLFCFGLMILLWRGARMHLRIADHSIENLSPVLIPSQESAQDFRIVDSWFYRLANTIKLGLDAQTIVMMIVLIGFAFAVGVFVFFEDLGAAVFGGLAGAVGALIALQLRSLFVLSKVKEQLPGTLEMLASAIRAGVSLEQGLAMIANRIQGFLSADLREAAKKTELGLSASNAFHDLATRYNSVDLRLLASAFAVHQKTGGELAKVLEQLAKVSRERQSYRRHLSGLTVSSRLAAAIVGAAAPGLLVYYGFQGDRLLSLWSDPSGRFLLWTAFGLELVGIIWILLLTRKQI